MNKEDLTRILRRPSGRVLSSVCAAKFFLYDDLRTHFGPIPRRNRLSAGMILALYFVLTQNIRMAIRRLRMMHTMLIRPLQVIMHFKGALSSNIRRRNVTFDRLFLSKRMRTWHVRFQRPTYHRTCLNHVHLGNFRLRVLGSINGNLIISQANRGGLEFSIQRRKVRRPINGSHLRRDNLSHSQEAISHGGPTAAKVNMRNRHFALKGKWKRVATRLNRIPPINVGLPANERQGRQFTLTTHRTLRRQRIFLTIRRLIMRPRSILYRPHSKHLHSSRLQLIKMVRFNGHRPNNFPRRNFTHLPMFLLYERVNLRHARRTIRLIRKDRNAIILNVKQGRLTGRRQRAIRQVFERLWKAIKTWRHHGRREVFEGHLAGEFTVLVFKGRRAKNGTRLALLPIFPSIKRGRFSIFFQC